MQEGDYDEFFPIASNIFLIERNGKKHKDVPLVLEEKLAVVGTKEGAILAKGTELIPLNPGTFIALPGGQSVEVRAEETKDH